MDDFWKRTSLDDDESFNQFRYAPFPKPIPIPEVGIFDAPTKCLAINVEWAARFLGALETLDQPDVWIGDSEAILNARREVREAIALWMTGEGCIVVDPCCPDEIEELRRSRRQDSRVYAHSLELLDDGLTPQSFAPNAPVDFSGEGNLSTNLCSLIEDFIVECLFSRFNGISDTAEEIQTQQPNFIPFFGSIFLESVSGLSTTRLNQLLIDQSARSRVACCMFDSLKDAALSFANWNSSLDDCGFTFPDADAEIAGIVAENLTDINYRAFVRELSVQVPAGASDNDCACDCTIPPDLTIGTIVDNGGGSYTLTSAEYTSTHVGLYGQPERLGWPTIRYALPACCTIISGTVDDPGTGGSLIGYYVDCDNGEHEAPGVYFPPLDTSYKFYVGYRAHPDSTDFEITIILDGG